MEPSEAAPDLVGRTSARLTALGVERRERLVALHLLAVLDASTDLSGRVRRPLDDLADEFELPVVAVMRSLEHLEDAGALRRDGGAVVLLDRDVDGVGGMHLAGFLDDVRAALDDHPHQQRSPWLARAGAGLIAVAAAIGILWLAPSQPSVVEQSVASGGTTAPVVETTARPNAPSPAPTDASVPSLPSAEIPAGDTAVVAAAGTCPAGEPTAIFEGSVLRITNPATSEIVVTAFRIGAATTPTLITVPAGETVEHAVTLPATTSLPVSIDEWDWTDPATARTCAS